MNVSELIKELDKVEDKSKEVYFCIDLPWLDLGMDEARIEEVLDNPDRVLLGNNFPAEKYERDYKYERGCT